MKLDDAIPWAEAEAGKLSNTSRLTDVVPAVEFLARQSPASHFAGQAVELMRSMTAYTGGPGGGARLTRNSTTAQQIGELLKHWARSAKEGVLDRPEAARARLTASTDLMEQVQLLLDDEKVHPAAAVMLAGAALEEYLRSMVEAAALKPKGKPGLPTYSGTLNDNGLLSDQDRKDVSSWTGLRDDAAHGRFGKVSLEQARIMAAGINLFIREREAERAIPADSESPS